MHIYEQEGLTQTELAELMQMGRASLGKLLERLEVKGWIERRADASDSRVRRV
jgi:MarR family transcriptional regulator for hemolysin